MGKRWSCGWLWVLGLAGLNACGGSSAKPDTGALAGAGAGTGYSGDAAGSGGGGAGGASGSAAAGSGPVVPSQGCPLTAPTREALSSKLEPIPDGADVRAVHMTAKGLFWTTNNKIYRLQSDGTGVQVAEGDDPPDLLTSNATQIAWHGSTDNKLGIWTLPLDGGSPTLVTPANSFVGALALDDTHAYFGGSTDNINRAPLAGAATPTVLVSLFGVNAIAISGGFAYYVESLGDTVMRVATGGGAPEAASRKIGTITEIAVDDSAIYAARLHGIHRIESGQPSEVKLLMPLATTGTSTENTVTRLLVDGERVFFVDQLENIGWVSKDGERCGYIVSEGKKTVAAVPRSDIALDAKYLYISDWPTRSLSRIERADLGIAR